MTKNMIFSQWGKKKLLIHLKGLLIVSFSLLTSSTLAWSQSCCLQHGGICDEKQCCDGTALSTECGDFKIVKLPPTPALESRQQSHETEDINQPLKKWLYVWNDPQSGTLHLSSTSPIWYRNNQYQGNYPRVLVYDEYYRLIDDTQKELDSIQQANIKQRANSREQQYENYQKNQKKALEMKKRKKHLETLLKKWMNDGKMTQSLKKMLEELAQTGGVSLGMTRQQIQQAWGEATVLEVKSDESGKYQEILKYQKGIVTFLNGRAKTLRSNP